MPLLMLKDLPRYEALTQAAECCPAIEPSACDAFFNLLRTGDDVYAVVDRLLAERGMSQGRFTVLALLGRECEEGKKTACCEKRGPATPATLAEEAAVTRATMTGLIDTLEKDGLVTRVPDPVDRRTVHVRLTDQGRSVLEEILPDYFTCVARLLRPLNQTERKQLVKLLQKVQAGVERGD